MAEHKATQYGMSLWLVQASSPLPPSGASQLARGGAAVCGGGKQSGVKKKASIHTVQALLGNSQNTALLSALFWSGIQNTEPYQLLRN